MSPPSTSAPKLAPIYHEGRILLAATALIEVAAGHLAQAQITTRSHLRGHLLEQAWDYRDKAMDQLDLIPDVASAGVRRRAQDQLERIKALTAEIQAASLALLSSDENVVHVDFAARRVVSRGRAVELQKGGAA